MSSRGERRDDERGAAAIIVTIFVSALLFGLCAVTVDVARWYAEAQRVQKAADVAASAGVVYMPQDIAAATTAARDVSGRNGYPNSGQSSVVVKPGTQPSQLDVAVSSTIPNIFGKLIGLDSSTITRHAVADYTGPQPMGSPCNTFGNEPPGTVGAGPAASQLSVPLGANCSSVSQFWMNVNGPDVPKGNGDQYAVRSCASGVSGCTGAVNDEFDPQGYIYLVRVKPAAVGSTITLQLYDPAFASTDDWCTSAPTGTISSDNWNPYATTDAKTRYLKSPSKTAASAYCTGDNTADGSVAPTVTTFGLREPSDSQNPMAATPQPGCTKQYPGYTTAQVTAAALQSSNAATYNRALAEVFHQWNTLCSFVPTEAGDYYLQVRTNVAWKGPALSNLAAYNALGAVGGAYQPPSGSLSGFAMYSQNGDDTSVRGGGSNRFAVRAFGGPAASVSVSALGKMSIYANANAAAPTFNLIRILPGAAGQTLIFKFFDIGDAEAAASLTVMPPQETTTSLTGCKATGYKTQTLPTCAINIDSTWNGKSETIAVPVPSSYTCTYNSPGGCWFRLKVNFGSGAVQDTTTWTAYVSGDPVRLIE
ncbi:flp pilus-assembly TadE/G-like family protein [Nocardioides sp. CN2-186]|uniref:TadE/TadG family type IV pilus assembly protein n=1 Tax=Nocardioides tweenelious TaxID=3156607 RepID=UPI0032B4EB24